MVSGGNTSCHFRAHKATQPPAHQGFCTLTCEGQKQYTKDRDQPPNRDPHSCRHFGLFNVWVSFMSWHLPAVFRVMCPVSFLQSCLRVMPSCHVWCHVSCQVSLSPLHAALRRVLYRSWRSASWLGPQKRSLQPIWFLQGLNREPIRNLLSSRKHLQS